MTNAEARLSKPLRPRKPEGSLGRTAQDGHLDSHTAPELWVSNSSSCCLYMHLIQATAYTVSWLVQLKVMLQQPLTCDSSFMLPTWQPVSSYFSMACCSVVSHWCKWCLFIMLTYSQRALILVLEQAWVISASVYIVRVFKFQAFMMRSDQCFHHVCS